MKTGAAAAALAAATAPPDAEAVVNALADVLLVVDAEDRVRAANAAAEEFFAAAASQLCGRPLAELVQADGPLSDLVDKVRRSQATISEYNVELFAPRGRPQSVDWQIAALPEYPGWVVVSLRPRTIAHKLDRQLSHLGAGRSVAGLAAALAHEVKNPLSGIRGAAQLLARQAGADERALTELITGEVDRICKLVDRMEAFSDARPPDRAPVNIHEVLDHVRRLAASGFAERVRFVERYDPSLPAVWGDRDQLVQVFLNLVKNAAEAVPERGGEIVLATAFEPGLRLALPNGRSRLRLPLVVSVQDNGGGVPDDIGRHLFEPFVAAKPGGTGLGLSLVAKIVGDHGGVVEFDSRPRQTTFRVMLPLDESGGAAS